MALQAAASERFTGTDGKQIGEGATAPSCQLLNGVESPALKAVE
jgi:hypothetical protein